MTSLSPLVVPKLDSSGVRTATAEGRGYADGYAEGARHAEAQHLSRMADMEREHADALNRIRAEADQLASTLKAAATALDTRTIAPAQEAHDSVLAAALDVAEALVAHAMTDEYTRAKAVVARAMSTPAAASAVKIRVSPEDCNLVRSTVSDEETAALFVADSTLATGDVIVDLEHGYIDAGIASAVARVRSELGLGGDA